MALPMKSFFDRSAVHPSVRSCCAVCTILCAMLLRGLAGSSYQAGSGSDRTSDTGVKPSTVASDHMSSASAKDNSPRRVRNSEIWRDANKNTIIIFVHGITGDCEKTWTNQETGAKWPELLLHDDAFAEADVLSYGYDSPQHEPALLIPELAVEIRDVLEELGALKHERIVFVAHSMGGLIVRS